jgi:cytochrome P450
MPIRTEIPVYHPDLYAASAIRDTYPHYAALRDLGPVVRLSKHKVYALPRYAECRRVLLDDETFVSSGGVALNPVANRVGQGTTLCSDGEEHARRRSLLAHRLTPRALRTLKGKVEQQAAAVVAAAVVRRTVDAVEVATALPMAVVPDLVGWPRQGREHLLRASEDGRIMPAECATMMIDYLAPSLDTTISAISSALPGCSSAAHPVGRPGLCGQA